MRTTIPVLFILFLLLSCEKEVVKDGNETDDDNSDTTEIDTTDVDTSNTFIILGDLSGMLSVSHDTIIHGSYNEAETFSIDINQDSVNDIQLRSIKWGSLSVGEVPRSRLWCLHDSVKINGYFENDTIFRHKYSTTGNWTDSTHDIFNYTIYTCRKIDANDSAIYINEDIFKASLMEKDEVIYLTNTFKTDSITLAESSYTHPPDIEGYGQDTVYYNYTTYNKDCKSFPADDFKYIGFKIHHNNTEKLGWIKIGIWNNYEIIILESSIQK